VTGTPTLSAGKTFVQCWDSLNKFSHYSGTLMIQRTLLLLAMTFAPLMLSGAATASTGPPNICPHTANRYLYQDNASAMNARTSEFLHTSLVSASQLLVDGRMQGFVFLDDVGNAWVTVAPDADSRVKTYFHDLPPPNLMLLSAFQWKANHPLPPWAHLEKCPTE